MTNLIAKLTVPVRIALIFLASAFILSAAWYYELALGYTPCPLCLQERYAYYFALVACPLAFWAWSNQRPNLTFIILSLVVLAFLANTVLGIYHSGVEWKWWEGPATCSGSAGAGSGSGSMLDKLGTMRVIRCDEAPWRFLGLSFAGYNAVFSAGLAIFSIWAAKGTRK